MATPLFKDRIVANMLKNTNESFVHNGYLYRQQVREHLMLVGPIDSLGRPMHKRKLFSIYHKSNINFIEPKKPLDQVEYYKALKEFKSNYDYCDWIDKEFSNLSKSPWLDELLREILTSVIM